MSFQNAEESHLHSLELLETLNEYYDFMISINNVIDMGSGKHSKDAIWWENASVIDDDGNKIKLDIKCVCVDTVDKILPQSSNISYIKHDFETQIPTKQTFDVLWSHDSFQYATNPIDTLKNWNKVMNEGGMLCLQIPSSIGTQYNKLVCATKPLTYFHHTLDNLIYMLCVNGFDLKDGFLQEKDGWIKIIAYKSSVEPMNPKTTTWYHLLETDLLPETCEKQINKTGIVRREELILQWITGSNQAFSI